MNENQNEQNNLANTTQESKSTNSTFCPSCGSKISENSSFCSHCGAKLTSDGNGGLRVIKENKKHSSGTVAWIITVIAIVALICTIAVFTVANRNTKDYELISSAEASTTTEATTTEAVTTSEPITTTAEEATVQTATTTVETNTTTTTTVSTSETSAESEEETAEDYIKILAQYNLRNDYGWYTYHFTVIENISDETIKVSTSTIAYSSDDKMLAVANTSCESLGPGCVTVLLEMLNTDEVVSYGETSWSISKSIYKSVNENLSYTQNDINNGAIFQVTNNGDYTAEFVQGYALFFLDGEIVDYAWTYFTDDDSEIKPGATISKQLTSYKDFDTIEFYLDGRHWGN